MYRAVWPSGGALVSINVVVLRRARLVVGWVTVRGFKSCSRQLCYSDTLSGPIGGSSQLLGPL